ncbi:hypothetical protein MJO29_000113 [Puccinia striiformis f. sp. tritici]|nr:hypothetical protein MJO29_000113 [Puccinia striiformis f. sp. tritici]KAI9599892.1 hypothetical protein KEM48_000484 [Puccinia striiformis f. sp. tritici PST-130]
MFPTWLHCHWNALIKKGTAAKIISTKESRFPQNHSDSYSPPPSRATSSSALAKRPHRSTTDPGRIKKEGDWALGGIACTMPRGGQGSLNTQLGRLGHGGGVLNLNPLGWTNGLRLIFDASSLSSAIDPLKTETTPITLKIYKHRKFGEGSMRRAYQADVKVSDDKNATIAQYVAKIRYHDPIPSIENHATNTLMYQASALLLSQFKKIVTHCHQLKSYHTKASKMDIVRHAVVVIGELRKPEEVYFLEARLEGKYVKYCINIDFTVGDETDQVDPTFSELMSALTHSSFHNSSRKSLICDLQGVDGVITDPQIIDVDASRWAGGNNSEYGIARFTEAHECNPVCDALNLTPPEIIMMEGVSSLHAGQPGSHVTTKKPHTHHNTARNHQVIPDSKTAPICTASLQGSRGSIHHLLSGNEGPLPDANSLFHI